MRCTHGYRLTHIETDKICFKSVVNSVVSIVRHFDLHRLILKLHGSWSMLSKWLTIYSVEVRSVCLQFKADFASLNTGKTVTVSASRMGSRIYRIIATFLLCGMP